MEMQKKKEKPKYSMWQNTVFMVSIAWKEKEKKVLFLGLALVVLSLAINLTDLFITPVILGAVESRASLGTLLTTILTFLGMSVVFRSAQTYASGNWLYGKITVRFFLNCLRNNKTMTTSYPNVLDTKFQKLNAKSFDTVNWNGSAGEAIWQTLEQLLENTAGFLIYLLMLSAVNPLLFVFITLLTFIGYFINRYLNEYRYRHREEEEQINNYYWNIRNYAEEPSLAKDIRLFGMHSWLKEIYQKTVDTHTAFTRRVENVVIWGRIADLVIAFLRNGIVYAYLIALVLDGVLDVPLFLLYFTAVGGFSSWVTGILSNFLTLHQQSLELSILRECLDYPEPFLFEEGIHVNPERDKKYEIRLEDVSFRYPEAEKDTLSHINLTLHPGEKLALVGLNGAGKTTLIKLMCGFLDPTSGRVLLDGKDIREYNRRDYYAMFSAVFQDFTLLPVTIAANVTQSEDSIDMERVKRCVEKAGLKNKVESLPSGYDTLLNREVYEDAVMLSGGETQRLMLARALYKNAPLCKINLRALKLCYKASPQNLILRILKRVWNALTPYVGIYLSALIIEELSGAQNPERLKMLVLSALFSAALIALLPALLDRFIAITNISSDGKMIFMFSEKMLDMDFCIEDDPETRRLLSTIRQNSNGGGWGIFNVTDHFQELLQAVFSLLGGAMLTISLFSSKVSEEAERFYFLNSPLFILLFLAVMLTVTWLSSALYAKGDSYRALNSDSHNLANRIFGYFGFLGDRQALATDMRLYRQDLICQKYNNNKEYLFGSKGFFARLARGPVGFYRSASTAVSSFLLTGLIYLFVCLKAWAGAFGIGMVTQYIGAISRFSGSINSLFLTLNAMRNNGSFLKLTFDFLDLPNVMYQGSLTVEKRRDRQYELEFRDVSFRYPGSKQYALHHVNMKFKVGQRLAVVGENGSGKTTFIKLLCRLYDPTEGTILLNGIDIRKYNYREYLSIFSVVFQDFALTCLPLGQNVAASIDYNKEKAKSSLKKAGFGERLKELPQGLETYLDKNLNEEGVTMSGGERQKIAIARTLYKNAPFIILDEPTAALDPIAEAEIYSKLNEIIEDRTAIYISHRLSSCRFCDDILVFHQGAIVQQGSHDILVADEKGKYHELWHAQSQYYMEEAS